jgi:hypothetical protein
MASAATGSLLIVRLGVGRTNAWRHQLNLWREHLAECGDLQRRANQTPQPRLHRERGQALDLAAHVRFNTDLRQRIAIETGQDGHAQHQRRAAPKLGGAGDFSAASASRPRRVL